MWERSPTARCCDGGREEYAPSRQPQQRDRGRGPVVHGRAGWARCKSPALPQSAHRDTCMLTSCPKPPPLPQAEGSCPVKRFSDSISVSRAGKAGALPQEAGKEPLRAFLSSTLRGAGGAEEEEARAGVGDGEVPGRAPQGAASQAAAAWHSLQWPGGEVVGGGGSGSGAAPRWAGGGGGQAVPAARPGARPGPALPRLPAALTACAAPGTPRGCPTPAAAAR